MGWCHEFGPTIAAGCGHPMVAGSHGCTCSVCGADCRGRFEGCPRVWERGPHPLPVTPRPPGQPVPAVPAASDATAPADPAAERVLTRTSLAVGRLSREVRRLAAVADALPERIEQAVARSAPPAGDPPPPPRAAAPDATADPGPPPGPAGAGVAGPVGWRAARPAWRAAGARWWASARPPR